MKAAVSILLMCCALFAQENLLSGKKAVFENRPDYGLTRSDTDAEELTDGKFREKKRTAVEKFYLGLWWVLKVLMVLALIAFIVWLRIRFDTWYVNWLMK